MSAIYAEFRGTAKDIKKAKEFINILTLCKHGDNVEEVKIRAKAVGMKSDFLFDNNDVWELSDSSLKANGDIVISFLCSTTIDGLFFEKQMQDFAFLTGRTAVARICNSQVGEAQFLTFHDKNIKWYADERNSVLTDEVVLILEDKETKGITECIVVSGAKIVSSIDDKPTIIIHGKKTSEAAQKIAKKLKAQTISASELDDYLDGWHLYSYTKQKNLNNHDIVTAEQFSALCGNNDGLLLTLTIKAKGKRHKLKSVVEAYIELVSEDSFKALADYINQSIYNPDSSASYPNQAPHRQAPVDLVKGLCFCVELNDTLYLGFKIANISPFIYEDFNMGPKCAVHVATLAEFYEGLSDKFSGQIYITNHGYLKGLWSLDGYIHMFNTHQYKVAINAIPPYNEKTAACSG